MAIVLLTSLHESLVRGRCLQEAMWKIISSTFPSASLNLCFVLLHQPILLCMLCPAHHGIHPSWPFTHKSVLLGICKRTSQLSENLSLDLALRSQNILLTTPSLSTYEHSNQVYPAAGSHNNRQVCKRWYAAKVAWTHLRPTGSDRLSCLQLGTTPCVCSFPLGTVSAPDSAKKGIYSSQGRPEAQCGRCISGFRKKMPPSQSHSKHSFA
jgi:hypothetical protein